MQPRSAGLLWDIATAARRIQGFVLGKSWDDYCADLLLRSGVERQFEIAGEAMSALRRADSEAAGLIPNAHRMIGMRNVLIHGYAQVNNLTVWRAANENLDDVIEAVEALLSQAGPPESPESSA